MIGRQFVTIDAGELLHLPGEPVVVGALDIFGCTAGFDLICHTPGWCATTSVFLRDRQANALVEGAGKECHLPSIGTSGHCYVFDIDGKRIHRLVGGDLDAIDEPAHSPGPGSVLPRIAGSSAFSSAKFRVKLVEGIVGVAVHSEERINRYVVMEEVDGCDRAASKNTGWESAVIGNRGNKKRWECKRHGDQHWKRAAAHPLWNVNSFLQSKRFPISGNNHM